MFNAVQDFTLTLLPPKRKKSQSGWISFNAVCCIHNGENIDKKGRGGVILTPQGGVTYHCFNCGFKTGYQPGWSLSFKFRKFLRWLGAEQNDIQRLAIESLRIKDLIDPKNLPAPEEITFEKRSLPKEALNFLSLVEFYELADKPYPKGFVDAVKYANSRQIDLEKYEFFWSSEVEHKLSHRVIVPFKYKGEIVGYSARALVDGIQPKYYSDHPGNFVFNLDNQYQENKFVIVCEGPFDAMSIDGVSTQTNDISDQQADLIEGLGKKVIVVPDFDKHVSKSGKTVWPGEQLVNRAIEYGWAVSFPIWHETCKDINDAVVKYGKLFVLKSILAATETNSLKIRLMANKI